MVLWGHNPIQVSRFDDSERRQILQKLLKGAEICSYQIAKIRKEVAHFKQKGYPIEKIYCDKSICKVDRKHFAYYYEWALDHREMSYKVSKIKKDIRGK